VREILKNSSHFRFVEKGTGEARMFTRHWGRPTQVVMLWSFSYVRRPAKLYPYRRAT
jgi:hypothetical protein